MTRSCTLIVAFALFNCSAIDDYGHAQPPGSLTGQQQCLPDGTCQRGNQDRVLICAQQQCVRPGFSGPSVELPVPVIGSENVSGNLVIDSDLRINPSDDSPIRIEAENIRINNDVIVSGNDALTQIEFVARDSIFLENGAVFSATNGEAIFLFRASQKLYKDGQVKFESGTCRCLYSDGGDEKTSDGLADTVCDVPGAVCSRPN